VIPFSEHPLLVRTPDPRRATGGRLEPELRAVTGCRSRYGQAYQFDAGSKELSVTVRGASPTRSKSTRFRKPC
jgi:hypothetical protein